MPGMWPGEGGISLPAAGVLAAHGCKWTASGETVLFNSLRRLQGDGMQERTEYLYRPYRCLTEKGVEETAGLSHVPYPV